MYELEPLPWHDRLRKPTKSDVMAEYARQQGVPVIDIPLSPGYDSVDMRGLPVVGFDASAIYTPLDEHRLGAYDLGPFKGMSAEEAYKALSCDTPVTTIDLDDYVRTRREGVLFLPRITCADGFSISVQASEGHYCTPRITFDGPYQAYELGFPSAPEPMLAEWQEEPGEDPCQSVYGYVPADTVKILLAAHGGIVS